MYEFPSGFVGFQALVAWTGCRYVIRCVLSVIGDISLSHLQFFEHGISPDCTIGILHILHTSICLFGGSPFSDF